MKKLLLISVALVVIGCVSTPSEITNIRQDTYSNGTEKGTEPNSETAIKFFSTFLRGLLFEEAADGFIKEFEGAQYYLCQGKGSIGISIPEFNQEKKSDTRDQFVVVIDEQPGGMGILGMSSPAHLSNGWLIVLARPANSNKWYNIWDKENGFESTPLDDAVKGKINEFILEIKLEMLDIPASWQTINGLATNQLTQVITFNINRKTNEFFYTDVEVREVKVDTHITKFYTDLNIEGNCSLSKR